MDSYTSISIILSLAVLLAYVNHRFVKLQATIAMMVASLLISVAMIFLQYLGIYQVPTVVSSWINHANFGDILLKGILSFLLFAGALTVDLSLLKAQKWEIGILSSLSTIASTVLVAVFFYLLLSLLGANIPFVFCLLFGALISPTDPIAVLATFKALGVSKRLQVCVAGESLFNDGVGIVLFTCLFQLAFSNKPVTASAVGLLLLQQTFGGLIYGAVLGMLARWLMRPIADLKIIMLLLLGMVSGGYSFALWLGISGPLAIVVFGIFIGHYLRQHSARFYSAIQFFWEVVDEVLNAVLFLLMGFEIMQVHFHGWPISVIMLSIPLVLAVRFISVAIPIQLLSLQRTQPPYTKLILTWGGLRGGLALALALSLPQSANCDLILACTYAIVAFSVIVQGITIKPLCRFAQNPPNTKST